MGITEITEKGVKIVIVLLEGMVFDLRNARDKEGQLQREADIIEDEVDRVSAMIEATTGEAAQAPLIDLLRQIEDGQRANAKALRRAQRTATNLRRAFGEVLALKEDVLGALMRSMDADAEAARRAFVRSLVEKEKGAPHPTLVPAPSGGGE